jgi:hypothetical protein
MLCCFRQALAPVALVVALLPRLLSAQAGAVPFVVTVDSSHDEVVITTGPYRLPAMGGEHAGHMNHEAMMEKITQRFDWPVEGMGRGFHMELRDAGGKQVSQRMLHHLQIINASRRQLILPLEEKIMAIGRETSNIMLPNTVGMPLAAGSKMRINIMWHNETATDIEAVYMTLRIRYSPDNLVPRPVPVLPISMDIADVKGRPNTFRIPTGVDTITREFVLPLSGRVLALSGHMHDWGTGLWLEDAKTGHVITRVTPTLDSLGRITHMPLKLYGVFGEGLKLEAGHHYRLVATYNNRSGASIDGAMGHLDGIIAVRDLRQWPRLGTNGSGYLDSGAWKSEDMMDMTGMNMPMDMPMPPADSGAGHTHSH